MTIELKVPVLPESVADATIVTWHKKVGEPFSRGDNLVDLETDKVVLEVPAPDNGVLKDVIQQEGSTVMANDVLAIIETGAVQAAVSAAPAPAKAAEAILSSDTELSPAVRRLVAEHEVDVSKVKGSGKSGRIVKQDVEQALQQVAAASPALSSGRSEQRVPMSRLRARVAERLLQAQHNAALLTTFNEINMQAVMDLRAKYKERFEKQHGVRLGFMSLFTKAVVEALQRFPAVNASIDGTDILYHNYYDIGIAVSTDRGLVVPVLRDADQMSIPTIEQTILDSAKRAQEGRLALEELQGGTFTITNGGVFGSLLSTPIINPPQTGILGMHKIEQRPIADNGQVVIRPMMYVALTYDHRIIDGKDSVQFLVTIKDLLEDPARLLLAI